MDNTEKSQAEIKITDRRAFTSEGSRRNPPRHPGTETPPQDTAAPPPNQVRPNPDPIVSEVDEEPEGIDFGGFIQYLGQIAIQQMLGSPDSSEEKNEGRLDEAHQTIEILSMLQQKTQGNLTPRESETLDQLLYHLKLEYARRAATAER